MKPMMKLGIGAVLCGAGLFLLLSAQRSIVKDTDCEDCDEELQTVHDVIDEVEGD